MKTALDLLAIGDLAKRTGLSVSAIRYYEEKGLVRAMRNAGGQRRFLRSDIRRLSFIQIAQKLGLSLTQIEEALSVLPNNRTPTRKDWVRISSGLKDRLDEQIASLARVRENLDGCIGCGCLSLKRCKLYNPDDRVGQDGPGPRHAM